MRSLLVVMALFGCGGNGQNNDHVNPGDDGGGDGDGKPIDADPTCATPGVIPAMKAQLVASSLDRPVWVAQPAGSTDLYVVLKTGHIRIVRNGTVLPTAFLDIADINIPGPNAEGGLLSMAFHPDYAANGRFFIYANVTQDSAAAVREYHRSANPDVATAQPVATLITQPNNGDANVGGTIAFGPDHALWVSTGDGGNAPEGQDPSSRRGKLLRIDVDHPTTPPSGNLTGGDPFVYDDGLRNPYRISFDRQTHELYLADAGNDKQEEVNIEPMGQGNKNYGWPTMEGMLCVDGTTTCNPGGALTLPKYTRPHQIDFSVIIGGAVYRGGALPCLHGRYIFGIYGTSGHLLSWVWNGSAITSETELSSMFGNVDFSTIDSINEDDAGELYLSTLDGSVYKIVPA
jgi:glucose/arabinose dehydrogenase